jgi:hypothetical protein
MSKARRPAARDGFLIGLVAITLVRAGEALAGEPALEAGIGGGFDSRDARPSAAMPSSWFAAPGNYSAVAAPEGSAFSKEEFRPRGRSISESGAQAGLGDDRLISDTTVWQRLSEFRAHDRVRVITLWQSGLSAVSLQAGKRGSPSLQWTSRLMNSGEAHGLLDRWLPADSAGGKGASAAGGVAHPVTHSANPPPGTRGEPAGKAAFGAPRPALP